MGRDDELGWYYLHSNGELIYKLAVSTSVADLRESDLVRAFWSTDPSDRGSAWTIVVEGLAAGARPDRVADLVARWGCTDEDAAVYAERIGVSLERDDDAARWLATTGGDGDPVGTGERAYEALADLARELGYRPAKMWGWSFEKIVRQRQQAARA